MVGENKNGTEIITEKQEQENEPDVDGTREEIVTKAEIDVREVHTVNDEIKSQDPDSQESSTSQKLVDKADKKLEDFKMQVENEDNKLSNLSNDDLRFFMNKMKGGNLENTDVFLFIQSELDKREKNDVDYDSVDYNSIEFFKKQDEKDEKDKEENIERIKNYSDERLVTSINDSLDMAEYSMKKQHVIAGEYLETSIIKEEIEEAKSTERNIASAVIEKFEKDFNDLKEKTYLSSVMGSLNYANELADRFNNEKDIKCKELAAYWVLNARDIENKNIDKINKFDLGEIDKKIKEICVVIEADENELNRERFQKYEEGDQRFRVISKEINKEILLNSGDNSDSRIMTEVDETGEKLGKEYEFEDEEFEKLKLFFGPIGGGRWDSALNVFLGEVGDDFELSTNVLNYHYNVKYLSENSIALLLILEDKKIKLTINFDHENKSINIGAKETITDLPESEIETEEVVQELDPELVRQFEEDVVTSQQEIEEEREERREKWEDEDDKESAIEEEKNTIEQRLEERLIKENQDILETEMSAGEAENQDLSGQRNVQEILKSYEKVKDLRNSLEAEINQEMTKKEEMSNSIQANLTPENADLSQLNSIERDVLKKSTNDVLKTTKNVLSMKEIDYLMETMGSESNFGDLKGTHENRKIEMEELQDTIDALDKFRELIEEFETLSERTLAEQREEVVQTVEGLEHIQKSNKKLFAALVVTGVVAGVVGLCLATGTPLPAFLTAKNIIIAGSAVAAMGTLAYLYKKDKLPSLKQIGETAKFATGLSLAGGFLTIDSLFNGKEVDKAFKFLCGTDLPSWAQSSDKK